MNNLKSKINSDLRSIEIQSALPVRTLGRQSVPEQKPEIDADQINNSPFNVMLNEEDYGE